MDGASNGNHCSACREVPFATVGVSRKVFFSIILGNAYAFEAELQAAMYAIEMAHRFFWVS